jgi:DNA/RNA-binding domain of Phe-tRNA-synthetase-like protein
MQVTVSEAWQKSFPGAVVGTLAMGDVANPAFHDGLEGRKRGLEAQLRKRFDGADPSAIQKLDVVQAYEAYYKRHERTYHVQPQLESVVFKGRPLPSVAALVEAMFMAEVKNMLLTAGHDLDVVRQPLRLEVSVGDERYTRLDGEQQVLDSDDMMVVDLLGIISCILHGPDQRTRIGPDTRRVLFVVYAPSGVGEESVKAHLEDIRDNVLLVTPQATTESLNIYIAG